MPIQLLFSNLSRGGCQARHPSHHPAPPRPVLGPEASEAFWLPLAPALAGELDEPFRYERGEVVHRLPSWRFEGRTIWGMTHGILSRFGDALRAAEPGGE